MMFPSNHTSIVFLSRSSCGFSKRALNAPFMLSNSIGQSSWVDAEFFSPLSRIQGFSVKGQETIIRAVIGLLEFISPTTVVRAVPARIVNAINRKLFAWLLPHIEQEKLKVLPAFAHAIANVEWLKRAFRIASLQHISPGFIGWREPRTIGRYSPFSVPKAASTTTAASRMHSPKGLAISNMFFAAVTHTKPLNAFLTFWRKTFDGCKPTELLTCYIYASHRANYTVAPITLQGQN